MTMFQPPAPPPPQQLEMMVAMAAEIDARSGSFVSLVTKLGLRYQGYIYRLNSPELIIALNNVRCFGTEGRRLCSFEISPSPKVYDYIIFRGSEVIELHFLSSGAPAQSSSSEPNSMASAHFASSGRVSETQQPPPEGHMAYYFSVQPNSSSSAQPVKQFPGPGGIASSFSGPSNFPGIQPVDPGSFTISSSTHPVQYPGGTASFSGPSTFPGFQPVDPVSTSSPVPGGTASFSGPSDFPGFQPVNPGSTNSPGPGGIASFSAGPSNFPGFQPVDPGSTSSPVPGGIALFSGPNFPGIIQHSASVQYPGGIASFFGPPGIMQPGSTNSSPVQYPGPGGIIAPFSGPYYPAVLQPIGAAASSNSSSAGISFSTNSTPKNSVFRFAESSYFVYPPVPQDAHATLTTTHDKVVAVPVKKEAAFIPIVGHGRYKDKGLQAAETEEQNLKFAAKTVPVNTGTNSIFVPAPPPHQTKNQWVASIIGPDTPIENVVSKPQFEQDFQPHFQEFSFPIINNNDVKTIQSSAYVPQPSPVNMFEMPQEPQEGNWQEEQGWSSHGRMEWNHVSEQ